MNNSNNSNFKPINSSNIKPTLNLHEHEEEIFKILKV